MTITIDLTKAAKTDFDPNYLRECFEYDPSSGDIRWKDRPESHFRSKKAWATWKGKNKNLKSCGWINGNGYLLIRLDGKTIKSHRIAFAIHHGYLPEVVDHINGNRSDNRACNLRAATHANNLWNQPSRKPKSGVKGVYWKESKKRWETSFLVNGSRQYAGSFKTIEEAAKAIEVKRNSCHGEFANHG